MPPDFTTDDHYALANSLSDLLIESIGNRIVAEKLRALRDAVWSSSGDKKDVRRVFHETLKDITPEQKTELLEAYARLGHINEIAGLAARAHYFRKLQRQGEAIPGGAEEFVNREVSTADAVGKLNQPVFEVVMTMHPTNTNSLPFMQAQRELGKAVESGNEAAIRAAMKQFAAAPILHQKNGTDANFTVRDETGVVLNYLGNIYDDLPQVYAQYDRALARKGGYNPLDLKLGMRFGSWGSSGDKDGNNNVTAESTLEAIALHTQAIVSRYRKDLEKLSSPELARFKEALGKADETLKQLLLPQISNLREEAQRLRGEANPHTSGSEINARFDDLSRQLAALRKNLDVREFEKALEAAYQSAQGDERDDTLDLLRKVRTFGLNFSKIEYRETAEEYSRVAGVLIDDYDTLPPEARAAKLTELLQAEGNRPQALLEAKKHAIVSGGATKAYSSSDPLPIAYHTLKRMELARDFPDMITDNVLAECGQAGPCAPAEEVKAQGLANMLEAQFMQRMAEKNGKRPRLGIVPLFEEPATMMRIDDIMRGVYQNAAYQAHLKDVAHWHGDGSRVQQVQIAHSDNARRSGLQAARAYIHEAHKKMRALNSEFGIKTQFFEGGSISDAYRNGVRAVSASVNAFELQDFAKFTFQGGDLVNYFSLPSSTERLFTRILSHSAERFKQRGDGWEATKRGSAFQLNRDKQERRERRTPVAVFDGIAIAALKDTLLDYQTEDFTPNAMGTMLAVLDFDGETKAGNRGSRAAKRGLAFANTNGVQAGALKPVDIEKIRTISFSEAFQHAGIVPSWLGSQKLEQHLRDEALKRQQELPKIFGEVAADKPLTAKQVHMIYERSPTFRDAMDRSAFALAMTDPEAFKWIDRKIDKRASGSAVDAKSYLERIKATYRNAGRLAVEALKGQDPPEKMDPKTIAESLERMTDDIARKSSYRDFLLYTKIAAAKDNPLNEHQRGIAHNAGDTVVHGRFPTADDPSYGERRVKDKAPAVGTTGAPAR